MTPFPALVLQGSVLDAGSLTTLGTAAAGLIAMFGAYKWLRDQFDKLREARDGDLRIWAEERDKDRQAWREANDAVCRRLEAVERNQRSRWNLEHQRIFELELARSNNGMRVPDCYRIAQRLPQEDDGAG